MEGLLAEHQRLLTDYRRDVAYWKSMHERALQRIERLEEELEQSRGEVRELKAELYGRKSEKSSKSDRSNDLTDPEEEATVDAKKQRGAQPGHAGHSRRDYSHLPVEEETVELSHESRCCPHCGKLAVAMSDTEDSDVVEVEVTAHVRRIHRRRYRVTCHCDPACRTLTAPLPPKLIPKSIYGISIWVLVLLDKFASYRPTERLLGQLEQYGLASSAGTVTDGLKKIEPLFQPIYKALCERNRQGDFHQSDETRWRVFVVLDGKKGYGWWLWVILGKDTVIYLLAPSRGQAVEEMRVEAAKELADPKLRQPCRKVLTSLQEHWEGLVRFVDDPHIPMDNNASERRARGPAVARKNFYGSGSLWSGRLTATMFSLFATLARWNINPRLWLAWYLESCATAGGTAPANIEPFLPWNLSTEDQAALALRTTPSTADTS